MPEADSTQTFRFSHYHGRRVMTLRERFWEKVDRSGECWLWEGCVYPTGGHGRFVWTPGKCVPAHRAAWLLERGDIPPRITVRHTCKNSLCVRPDHLFLYNESASFWNKVDKAETCWLWKGATSYGYGKCNFRGERNWLAHRASWVMAHGEIPEGLWVLHKCDVRACVNPDHLFLGTPTDNVRDMMSKGRHYHGDRQWTRKHPERVPRGEKAVHAKLTAEKVREMRRLFAAGGISKMELSRRFGVTHATVRRILSRTIWTHVE